MDKQIVGYSILDDFGSFTYGPDNSQTFETLEEAEAEVERLTQAGWRASALTIVGLIDLWTSF